MERNDSQSAHFAGTARFQRREIVAFLLLATLVPLAFALYTHHIWEDFFITFRHSVNLCEGKGLVYNPGERVHGFTSPIGVLLPALCYWLKVGPALASMDHLGRDQTRPIDHVRVAEIPDAQTLELCNPDWAVVRPIEKDFLLKVDPEFKKRYVEVKYFDVGGAIEPYRSIHGWIYMNCDARFCVFKKKSIPDDRLSQAGSAMP